MSDAGKIVAYGAASPPTGWLVCDGASLLRASFPDLFGAIGTVYGAADGTHFSIPDLRGRFTLGKSTSGTGSALGEAGGALDHGHTSGHTHPVVQPAAHAAHSVTEPGDHGSLSHSGFGVDDHGSASHSGASIAAHSVTPSSSHGTHAAAGSHTHDSHSSNLTGGSSHTNTAITSPTTHAAAGSHSHNAHSGHNEGVSSHSVTSQGAAHSSMSHSETQPDAHVPTHSGTSISAHGAHAGMATTAGSETTAGANPPYLVLVYIIGTGTAPVPAGAIFEHGGTSSPTDHLACDGASYLRATYPDLFDVIGTTFGAVDGTHFSVPDLRGRHPLGKATSGTGSTLGSSAGTFDHAHAGGSHTHPVTQASDHGTHTVSGPNSHQLSHTGGAVATHSSMSHSGFALSSHSVSQSSGHGTHSTDAVHSHSHTRSTIANPGSGTVLSGPSSHASAGGHTHDAHDAHSGASLSAHSITQASAHSASHSVTQPTAHSLAHTGAALTAHSAHAGATTSSAAGGTGGTGEAPYLGLNYVIKTTTSIQPIGTLFAIGAPVAPGGAVLANGAAISRTTYADLYAAIGDTFGPGDGSTTFNVPDLRGRIPRGAKAAVYGSTQYARPDADVSAGSWTTAPLYAAIDESSPSDADFIESGDSNTTAEVGLGSISLPSAGTVTVRYRFGKDAAGGNARDLIVALMEGAVQRAGWTESDIADGWTTQARALSTAERNAIGDWANLSLRFTSGGDTGGPPAGRRSVRVSWAELEAPGVLVDPGPPLATSGGRRDHTHTGGAHSHGTTQPGDHGAHSATQPGDHGTTAHGGMAVATHSLSHSGMSVANHSAGQAGSHGTHASSTHGSHDSHSFSATGALDVGSAVKTGPATHAGGGSHTHGAHSAHSGFGVSSHAETQASAHSLPHTVSQPGDHAAPSSHAGFAVDGHSAHSGFATTSAGTTSTDGANPAYLTVNFAVQAGVDIETHSGSFAVSGGGGPTIDDYTVDAAPVSLTPPSSPTLYIVDATTLEVYGIIDRAAQLDIIRRYWGIDTFELRIDARQAYADQLVEGRLLYAPLVDFDAPLAFLIEQSEFDHDAKSQDLIVRGRTIDGVGMEARLVIPPAGLSHDEQNAVPAETAMKHYVDEHAGPSADADRQVPNLAIATDAARGIDVNAAGRYQRVLDLVLEIGYTSGLGWKTTFESGSNSHVWEVIEGTDRSASVFFDLDFDTLERWEETKSLVDSKTLAVIAGQGEGVDRDIVIRPATEPTGLDRREAFIDARDIALGETAQLEQRGDAFLAAAGPESSIAVVPRQFGSFQYTQDWHLGDVVLARNAARSISRSARVIEVKLAFRASAAVPTVTATLDRVSPTLGAGSPFTGGRADQGGGAGTVSEVSGALAFTGRETSTLTGTQNNVSLGAATETFRWDGSSDATFTGMTGGSDGRQVTIENVTAAKNLTLANENGSSTAGNRYTAPNATDYVLRPGEGALLRYDSTTTRWLIIARAFAGSDWKAPVRFATTGTLPANTRTGNVLLADAVGALPAQDGVSPAVGDRGLIKDEATGANRGVFVVDALGSAASAASAEVTSQRAGFGSGGATSISATFPGTPTQGNLILAYIGWRSGATINSVPSGWLLAKDDTASDPAQALYYKIAGASEPTAPSWGFTASVKASIRLMEYSNGAGWPSGSGSLDKTNSNSGSGTAGTTGATGVLTQADEVAVTGFVNIDTFTWGSHDNGQTESGETASTGGATSTRENTSLASKVTTATTSVNYGATLSSSGTWRALVATFKPNSAIAGTKWQMTRASDMDATGELNAGTAVYVNEGTTNGDAIFSCTTNGTITINSTSTTWARQGATISTSTPAADGTAAAGSTGTVSDAGHVHPGNTLGYVERTTNQGTITTLVDLTSMSVTVTVPSGHRVLLLAECNFLSSVSNDEAGLYIREGSTTLDRAFGPVGTTSQETTIVALAVLTPTAGSHTYKLSAERHQGTGNITAQAGTDFPMRLLVLDIGV